MDALTNAVQMFQQGKQWRQQQDAMKQSRQDKANFGQMLMGNDSGNLMETNPQMFMQGQQYLQQQQKQKQVTELKQRSQHLYSNYMSGNENAGRELAKINPELFGKAVDQRKKQQETKSSIGTQKLKGIETRVSAEEWATDKLGNIAMMPEDQQESAFNNMLGVGQSIFGEQLPDTSFEQAQPMLAQARQSKQAELQKDLDLIASGDTKDLRNRYEKKNSNMIKMESSYNKILQTKADATGDVALIFQYMKMLDPASTVGTGEQASVSNAAGISQKVMNFYNQALKGDTLSPEQRGMIRDQSKAYYLAEQESTDRQLDLIADYAAQSNIPLPKIFGVEGSKSYKARKGNEKLKPKALKSKVNWTSKGFTPQQIKAIKAKQKDEGWSDDKVLEMLNKRGY